MTDIVIVNGARTAMGGFQGSLANAVSKTGIRVL